MDEKINEYIEFVKAGFNRIPISREISADMDTPLSAL